METWDTYIGNSYLEAKTVEKIYIIAGNEFGDRKGHIIIVAKASYVLWYSVLWWHERFSNSFRDMVLFMWKLELDIWIRQNGYIYEYIDVYVDDLAIAARYPKSITDELENKYKFNLKVTGPISFHFGCDLFRDSNCVLCFVPHKYIDKMFQTYTWCIPR